MLFNRLHIFCFQKRFGGRKWQKTKDLKGANDIAKARVFSVITKRIESAIKARNGETDTSLNQTLAVALHQAKAAQMPKIKVDEAIKRALAKKDGSEGKILIYEGLGPNGVAVIVEALVTNPNKTAAEIKSIFKKNGGSMGPVEYLFKKQGFIQVAGSPDKDMETAIVEDEDIDLGKVQDIKTVDSVVEINCLVEDTYPLQQELQVKGYQVKEWGFGYFVIDGNYVSLSEEQAEEFERFLDALQSQDEVIDVYHNIL